VVWSVLGGLLVIGAGFNGASFLDFGHDSSSLIMLYSRSRRSPAIRPGSSFSVPAEPMRLKNA
jgi:hypothetical protein